MPCRAKTPCFWIFWSKVMNLSSKDSMFSNFFFIKHSKIVNFCCWNTDFHQCCEILWKNTESFEILSPKDSLFDNPISHLWLTRQVFFQGGLGVPHPVKILSIPHRHLSPFLDQGLSPPLPRFIPKNLNTFWCQIWLLLSSKYLKKLYFMLKITKMA